MAICPHNASGRRRRARVLWNVRIVLLALLSLTIVAAGAAAQPPAARPPGHASPPVDPDRLPIDVGRIQKQLQQAPPINLELTRPVFRAEVVQPRPQWLGTVNWLGDRWLPPAPTMPAWHNEFLNMVTPPQARMWGQSRDGELLQLAATSIVQALFTQALVSKVRHAAADRRAAQAREEVDAALAEWERQQHAVSPPATGATGGPSQPPGSP